MDLVYIYGPPGVGKFTVATSLSKLTGYRLFHNQLSIEFVRSVFDFGTPSFNRLVLKFRAEMMEQAAKDAGKSYKRMVSRAYHDSLFIARISPVAMLFIPCRGGISHRPDEYATPEWIGSGVHVLARTLAQLAA